MNEAVMRMLARYERRRVEDDVQALREILQEIALLGLWRSRFFERAAFYGGTALRILHGLDRYSEGLDFSLLKPAAEFDLSRYCNALEKEISAFGFDVTVTGKTKSLQSTIQSAFLKADTLKHLLVINTTESLTASIPRGQVLKIKIEVDTDPPPGFDTETRFLLQPIPFSVRAFSLPDMFAGKMHAVLCRGWKGRVKGRDWYDLIWYVANHPQLHLKHLEQRMIQSGHLKKSERLTPKKLSTIAETVVGKLNVDLARREVEPFVKDPEALTVWSRDFFLDVVRRIVIA
jgi:predicted nucleotidyltransferase component of viral defense system